MTALAAFGRWVRLLGACALAVLAAPAGADETGMLRIAGVWRATDPSPDALEPAMAALAAAPVRTNPAVQVPPGQAGWLRLELPPSDRHRLLELTHPTVRNARLLRADASGRWTAEPAGTALPPAGRLAGSRFPVTFAIAPSGAPQTVYLWLRSATPVHGQLRLWDQGDWTRAVAAQRVLAAACLLMAALAATAALVQAARRRSLTWAVYGLLCLTVASAAIVINGWFEDWLWPALSPWRGPIASALACAAAGLALLLARAAFALELRAPRLSRVLAVLGVAGPLAGLAGMALGVALHQLVSHLVVAVAFVVGWAAVGVAWRTANRPALWLLGGFAPLTVGVGLTTLGIAGLMAYQPWMLLAISVTALVELSCSLRGLVLLERRQALVDYSLDELRRATGTAGETRESLLTRLAAAPPESKRAVLLLRCEGLRPGGAAVLELDAVALEHFLHELMAAAVRPGGHVGRWSFHELAVVLTETPGDWGAADSLASALFAAALRSGERWGLTPAQVGLRIAQGRLGPDSPPLAAALQVLGAALDHGPPASRRRLLVDLDRRAPKIDGQAPLLPVPPPGASG